MQVPSDLGQRHMIDKQLYSALAMQQGEHQSDYRPDVLSTPGLGFVLNAFCVPRVIFHDKMMIYPEVNSQVDRLNYLVLAIDDHSLSRKASIAIVPDFATLFSPGSQT